MSGANARANQKRRTRKDLLQAAARLLKEGRNPSLEEIAEEALVSRATAYRYFPNVEALLIEAPLDLALPDGAQLELFSFPDAPPRPSRPEAQGLRHLAFAVDDVAQCKAWLERQGVAVEAIRLDEYTGRRFTFFADPDGLPLELYEAVPAVD